MRLPSKQSDLPPVDAEIAGVLSKLQDDGFPAEDYALVATAVLERGEGSRAAQLLAALETHRWADLPALRYWEGERDNIEAYAVRSTDGRIAVVAVLDPVEPLVAPRLVRRDYLTAAASQELLDTLQPDWWPLAAPEIESLEVRGTRSR